MSNQKTTKRAVAGLLLSCFLLHFIVLSAAIVAATATTDDMYVTLSEPDIDYTEPCETESIPTRPTELNNPLLFSEVVYTKPTTIAEAWNLQDIVQMSINLLWNELECQLYSVEARTAMEQEIERLNEIYDTINYDINCFYLWEEKLKEYPYATKTWLYLKDMGYSDIACAGILGNLMAECGGHTLNLDPYLYDKNTGQYYGMFQWSRQYYPKADGMNFEEQLAYFKETVRPIFETWGKNYQSGFTHDDFNTLESPRDAALAFAKVYERCASWTYERRQNFSEVAYQYFVLDFEKA